MITYEFQFRWHFGRHAAFGIDVLASSIEEAVVKANAYFDCDECENIPVGRHAERVWVNLTRPVTARDICTIYEIAGDGQSYTVTQFRKLQRQVTTTTPPQ